MRSAFPRRSPARPARARSYHLLRSILLRHPTAHAIGIRLDAPFRRLLRWALLALAGLALLGAVGAGRSVLPVAPKLPDVETLRDVELQEPLYVYARDGQLMALFGETRRYPVDDRGRSRRGSSRPSSPSRTPASTSTTASTSRASRARSGCWPPPTTSACRAAAPSPSRSRASSSSAPNTATRASSPRCCWR